MCISDFCKKTNLQIFIRLRVGFTKNYRIFKFKEKKERIQTAGRKVYIWYLLGV